MYYENAIYNNVLFDRPLRLQTGAFNTVSNACLNGTAQTMQIQGGTLQIPDSICETLP
jgi:hypothetical protein